jgi:hypothetical protein
LLIFCAQADPADVAVAGLVILDHELESTERQTFVDLAQLTDAILVDPSEGIAFRAVLVGAARVTASHHFKLALGLGSQIIEPGVKGANVLALTLQLG